MDDIGFNGTGSKFNTRFGSNSEVLGKQLNDMAYGIQTGLPQPGVGSGQSIAFTSGGALFSPETDPNIFGRYQYNTDPPQFKCVVYVDPSGGEDNLKYYLKIARGVITATGTLFPFTQGSSQPFGGTSILKDGWVIPCQERMIFDVALSPKNSRTPGPLAESTSAWMASNGKFELKTDVGHYYVTASFLDYNDSLNWYSTQTFINKHEPWISIVPNTGASKNNIFTQNTPTTTLQRITLGDVSNPGQTPGQWNDFPYFIGYGMQVIARIDWKEDQQMWEVRQEMVGPIVINIPINMGLDCTSSSWPGSGGVDAYYAAEMASKFINQINNFNLLAKMENASFTDSDVLAEEWWYDPKDF